MRRPRKIITRVIVFLLLGAIVNVAVAWGCAMTINPFDWPQGSYGSDVKRTEYDHWSAYRNDVFGAQVRMYARRSGLYLYDSTSTLWLHQWRAPWEPKHDLDITSQTIFDARGWPAVSMWSQMQLSAYPAKCVRGIQTSATVVMRRNGGGTIPRCLPLEPIYPGFAINTIFYAAILWLLFFAPGSVRRAFRRRRGLCPACAYPIGTSPVCTECGKPVTPKSVEPA